MNRAFVMFALSLFLVSGAFAETAQTAVCTADAAAATGCNCEASPAPLDSFFFSASDHTVSAQPTASGDVRFSVTVPALGGSAVWDLSFEPVVYTALGNAVNQQNAARLAAIEQALRAGSLTQLNIELRDHFNGESTFLAIVDGDVTEALDRAGARNALGSGTSFGSGETVRAVAFVDALGYQDVPMILRGRMGGAPVPAPTPTTTAAARFGAIAATQQQPQPAPQPPQQVYAACAIQGGDCTQNPPTLPCARYSSATWVTISCPGKQDQTIPWYQLMLQWDFWKTLVCICSFTVKVEPQVQNGTCNWYRELLQPWNKVCGCR